jgi:hypothetical protein
MLKHFSVVLISAIAALAFSCSSQGEEEKIISFEVIHGGPYTSIADKREVVITNNADYQKLMSEVYSNLDQMPRIPDVDFTKNDVVGVFMGAKSNGGYSINVDKVIKRSDAVTVSVYETSAGKNCSVTEAITQPYEIVKVPKLNQKVKFLYKQRVKDCQ